MKALSIRQPWASLIVNGYKDIENREWWTGFRGRFLVHAGKTMTKGDYEACRIFLEGLPRGVQFVLPPAKDLQRGGIVGEAWMMDCVNESESPWFCGRYGFVLKGAKPLPFRDCLGKLGFFEVPE